MCNLYHVSPKDQFEVYVRRHAARLILTEFPDKLIVGPFGAGHLIRTSGTGELVGVVGQWGLIRPGAPNRMELVHAKASGMGA